MTARTQYRRASSPLGRWRVLLLLGLLAGLLGMHGLGPGGAVAVGGHSTGEHSMGAHSMGAHSMGAHSMGAHSMGAHSMGGHASHHSRVAADHSHVAAGHSQAEAAGEAYVCHGGGAGDDGGHAHHADATCASGAVGAGPVLPAPLLAPGAPLSAADDPVGAFPAALDGGRAPPSLAELQLLRI
ncbi:DUF6153 family protein [Streptomyces sp. NPDC058741]|uniref:DUF6153 family protein n=1 Tax=unclassified Streptomyces TaxID=2593676 RepID=UPI003687CD25